MPNTSFIVADPITHLDALLSINTEYVSWVLSEMERSFGVAANEIVGASAAEYVAGVIQKVCGERPPQGVFYLIVVDDAIAGMGGLRFVRSGVAEIKRLYVEPAFRGRNLGEITLQRLLSDASRFGYQSVCLDTGPFMKSAHRLYEAHGFVDCTAYEGVEVPAEFHARWRFMQRSVPKIHDGWTP